MREDEEERGGGCRVNDFKRKERRYATMTRVGQRRVGWAKGESGCV
jgi:hypothetical protein